jgi:hypothetical protein
VVCEMKFNRALVSLAIISFGLFHAALGFAVIDRYARQDLPLIALGIYVLALIFVTIIGEDLALPKLCAWVCVVVTAAVPALLNASLENYQAGNYTTWYVSAMGTILAITAVRQGRIQAAIGTAILIFAVVYFAGFAAIFNSGLVGAVLLVFVGLVSAYLLSSAEAEAEAYKNQASATLAATAANSAARQERKARLSQTLSQARPLLDQIARRSGALSAEEKFEARLLEAELRDEIRGRGLMSPGLKKSVRNLRQLGVDVQLLDDGGLEDAESAERAELLERVAREIAGVTTGKVVVRAVRGETWRITVAALRKESAIPDLFLRL